MFEDDDDHAVIVEAPINEADLFGDDPAALSHINHEIDPSDSAATAPVSAKRKRSMNRLAPLNHAWLLDERKEGVTKVNGYFKDIKYKSGQGQEAANLSRILKHYEYWAQQCYPKLCFQDVIEKVEDLHGKAPIRLFLQQNRNKEQFSNDDNLLESDNTNIFVFGDDQDDVPKTSFNSSDYPLRSSQQSITFPIPQINTPTPKIEITDKVRKIIDFKREEAIAKRKRKLEESMSKSILNSSSETSINTPQNENLLPSDHSNFYFNESFKTDAYNGRAASIDPTTVSKNHQFSLTTDVIPVINSDCSYADSIDYPLSLDINNQIIENYQRSDPNKKTVVMNLDGNNKVNVIKNHAKNKSVEQAESGIVDKLNGHMSLEENERNIVPELCKVVKNSANIKLSAFDKLDVASDYVMNSCYELSLDENDQNKANVENFDKDILLNRSDNKTLENEEKQNLLV